MSPAMRVLSRFASIHAVMMELPKQRTPKLYTAALPRLPKPPVVLGAEPLAESTRKVRCDRVVDC